MLEVLHRGLPMLLLHARACRVLLVAAVMASLFGVAAARAQNAPPAVWTAPEVGALPDDDYGRLIRRGRELITATYAHIGPEVADPAKRYARNNLACSNCHLDRK